MCFNRYKYADQAKIGPEILPVCKTFKEAKEQYKRVETRRAEACEMVKKGLALFEVQEAERLMLEEEEEFLKKDKEQRDLEAEELVCTYKECIKLL